MKSRSISISVFIFKSTYSKIVDLPGARWLFVIGVSQDGGWWLGPRASGTSGFGQPGTAGISGALGTTMEWQCCWEYLRIDVGSVLCILRRSCRVSDRMKQEGGISHLWVASLDTNCSKTAAPSFVPHFGSGAMKDFEAIHRKWTEFIWLVAGWNGQWVIGIVLK